MDSCASCMLSVNVVHDPFEDDMIVHLLLCIGHVNTAIVCFFDFTKS